MFKLFAAKLVAPRLRFSFNREDDSYYNIEENSINLDLDPMDYGFLRHLRDVHGCDSWDKIAPQTWALLHEVGHSHTWIEEEDEEDFTRIILQFMDGTDEAVQNTYFDLPNEWEATEWAIKYVERHPHLIKIIDWMLAH